MRTLFVIDESRWEARFPLTQGLLDPGRKGNNFRIQFGAVQFRS